MKVLLYYKYVAVPNPVTEAEAHRAFCQSLGLKGRILIGTEGINGTCSGEPDACEAYKQAMEAHPLFSGISYKESDHPTHAFKKLFVRVRPEVVTLKGGVEARNAAPYITPKELHDELERGEDLVLVDMRNDYEAVIGRFRNAVTLPMKNFRDLPDHLPALEQYKGKNVVTYCTGGIRCEKASALLKEAGFKTVRQLEGGIVRYCEQFPDGYYDGSLFVFDDRRAMRFPGRRKPDVYISHCLYCSADCDRFINCADDRCHEMFICCPDCDAKHRGFCKATTHAVTA